MAFSSSSFLNEEPFNRRGLSLAFRFVHVLLVILPCLGLSYWLAQNTPVVNLSRQYHIALIAGLLCALFFDYAGLYGKDFYTARLWLLRTFLAWSAALLALWLVLKGLYIPAVLSLRLLAWWLISSYLLFILARIFLCREFKEMRARGHFLQRAVILGRTELGLRIAAHIKSHDNIHLGLLGFIDDNHVHRSHPDLQRHPESPPLLGDTQLLKNLIQQEKIEVVFIAAGHSTWLTHAHLIEQLRQFPIDIMLVCDLGVFNTGTPMSVNKLITLPIVSKPLGGAAKWLKRTEDLCLTSLLLALFAPIMLLIALAIRLDSPGPVLFRQERYGYNKRLIKVYKFRSMYHHLRDEHAECQTDRNDPRVTRVGRFIRKTSLDELPQLFNVLAGDMSLVGPRPHTKSTRVEGLLLQDAVTAYISRYRVKPGMTGLAQIQGYRGKVDTVEKIQRRVELDLHYIDNWSLALDLMILLKTIPSVLRAHEVH